MKKLNLFKFYAVILLVMALSSCNVDEKEENDQFQMEDFRKDLQLFSSQQKDLVKALSFNNERSISSDESIINCMKKNLNSFCTKYERILELPVVSSLSEEKLAMYSLDYDEALKYIKANASDRMYQMMYEIVNGKKDFIDITMIINSQDLLPNEMLALVNIGVVINNSSSMYTSMRSPESCLKKYNSERNRCTTHYVVSCGLSFIGGGGIATAAGVLWATYEYNSCMDGARSNWEACR